MTITYLLLTLLTVFLISLGQILFKIASVGFEFSLYGFYKGIFSIKFFAAMVVYFLSTVLWIYVLKVTPLRLAYPFVALAFIIVPSLSFYFLGESFTWKTMLGAFLIFLGVFVSVS